MKIFVTGNYEPGYNRNHVILSGLENMGHELTEFPYKKRNRDSKTSIRKLSEACDLIFLPSFTHLDVPFIRRITKKLIVFDPLISRYLSKVFDYKTVWKYSPRAFKNYLKDKRAFNCSNLIIADTKSHKDYYTKQFGVAPAKIAVVYVGVHTGDFYPKTAERKIGEKIKIGFYGSFIPLHGIEKIIAAAKLLEKRDDLEFMIYGDGPGFKKIHDMTVKLRLSNTILKGWVNYGSLNDVINDMDICLGIFGDSLKAELVIPNKIFHYAACRKPIITAETKGVKEIFENGKNIILIKNDPGSLADSIELLADNNSLSSIIAKNGYEIITENYNEKMIASEFTKYLNELMH
jgi:glycosyltransferase involved in cell wall biosynthesis